MCLGALHKLHLQLLLLGRGTPMVALAALHVLFIVVMDACCCGLLVRRLAPCSWAAGISCHLFFGFKVR